MAGANHVRIDAGALGAFGGRISSQPLASSEGDPAHHRRSSDEETLAFVLTLDAINFGSGWFPFLAKRPGMSGYFTVATSLAEHFDVEGAWNAQALRGLGATRLQVYSLGLVPHALPDMAAYTFYRFECALRSSTILGFFGIPTLGYYIKLSFDNLYYGEVWTYLYALFALVALGDWWSGLLRRRAVAA